MKDFMFRFLAWLVTLPLIVGAVAFAIVNVAPVNLTLSPFHPPFSVPLYMPVLAAIGFGFLFGCLMTWAAFGRLRSKSREQRRKIRALESQLAKHSEQTYKYHNYSVVPPQLLEKRP